MIDEARIKALCEQIERGQLSDGVSPETGTALAEIEQLIGTSVRQYTEPLRGMLKRKRIPDWSRHTCDVLGQTMRIRGIARIFNQGEAEQIEREKVFKVEVEQPIHWPMSGDWRFLARIYQDGKYTKSITCIIRDKYIDSIQVSSKSLSKREKRSRKLSLLGRCDLSFQYHIERLHRDGIDVLKIEEIDYEDFHPHR